MTSFPAALTAVRSRCYVQRGLGTVELHVEPFLFDGESVSRPFRLDGIELDLDDLPALAGRTFAFPINPQDGYIDGSIYIGHRHCSFDVGAMTFGAVARDRIPLIINGVVAFSSVGWTQYRDSPVTIAACLDLPLGDAALAMVAHAAIQETEAATRRDHGKVMAHLARSYRDTPYMKRLSDAVAQHLTDDR